MSPLRHDRSLPSHLVNLVIDRKVQANTRRKIVRILYDDWFATHGLKLGRDYFIEFHRAYSHVNDWTVRIDITNPNAALMFKLAWVGV